MRYLDLIRYIHEKEETTQYSDQYGHDYINYCELKCGGMSVKEVYQDARLAERGM